MHAENTAGTRVRDRRWFLPRSAAATHLEHSRLIEMVSHRPLICQSPGKFVLQLLEELIFQVVEFGFKLARPEALDNALRLVTIQENAIGNTIAEVPTNVIERKVEFFAKLTNRHARKAAKRF